VVKTSRKKTPESGEKKGLIHVKGVLVGGAPRRTSYRKSFSVARISKKKEIFARSE